ncbi:MAG: hypothetical protein COA65_02820 [Rhodospirillaceae bacterium]|nr:MAG: hypothetical protein COA65_02820 [Rhodospirillaceae bacterium]
MGKLAVNAIRSRQGGFLVAVLFFIVGCSSVERTVTDFSERVAPTCPDILILTDATRLTRFSKGSFGDLADIQFEGELRSFDATCSWQEGAVVVELGLEFVIARGPAYSKETAGLPYFIGVTDLDRNVLLRETFTAKPKLPSGQKAIAWTEKIKQRIPLDPGTDGGDYAVYIGLKLSHAELDYNRQWYGR